MTATDEADRIFAPYRDDLLAHCYRMTGSLSDAEDALQDGMIRAWKAYASFEGRSSLRTWLYRIVTNACLDLIAARRRRTLPEYERVAGSGSDPLGEPSAEVAWLEPFPGPDARLTAREAIRLAFVVALQFLPARQRAVLILRDVVGLSADETAEALELTTAAVTSALQRARDTLARQPWQQRAIDEPDPALLARYQRAWESGDPEQLIDILAEDIVVAMPPFALWVRGRADAVAMLRPMLAPGVRLIPLTVNAAPAFAVVAGGALVAISVLAIAGGQVAAIHSFLATPISPLDPARFGLTDELMAP